MADGFVVGIHPHGAVVGTKTECGRSVHVSATRFLNPTAWITNISGGNGSTFTVSGPYMDRDRALLSGGVNVQVSPTVNIYAYYDGQPGGSEYSSNTVSAGVKIDF